MAFLAEWPWQRIGNLKYFLFAPIILKALHANVGGGYESDNWCLHVLIVSSLRYIQHQCWNSYSRLHCLVKKHQIQKFGTDFVQVDREFHCDNFIIFQALVAVAAHMWVPGFSNLSVWNFGGILSALLVHMGATEFLYYWAHRALHEKFFYSQYHSYHHASSTPEPSTAGTRTFLEELLQTALMAVAIMGSVFGGRGSIALLYIYLLAFDFLKHMGHCNCEFVPLWAYTMFPPLKYLLFTPSYHSLHHIDNRTNFCLFMPLYDYLGGTRNKDTWSFYVSLRKGSKEQVPQLVFLAHCIDILSSLHVSFVGRTLSSIPFRSAWYQWPVTPLLFIALFPLWIWGRTFVAYEYMLRGLHAQTWVVPRYGFHYFLPFGKHKINQLIEQAILDADAKGVKVISLAALNKNEALNGGGLLFVKKHKDLKVRVVHGNTLTAAVILYEIPPSVSEVFLTGATSKLGRAIAIYLCRNRVRVLMLTSSRERYEHILNEVPEDCRPYLVQVTKYQAGKNCKTWIIGKWTNAKEQSWAPVGTHFHQFVIPPVQEVRKDCTYGKLAGMHLPKDIKGLRTCEYTFGRGVVAACHAGGLLHALEGWDHHEVGSIDVDRIDTVWEAALKHGMTPA
ncbi:hypothetical protein O6H91_13G071200 [Diphasiastrum complanatum]|uniref:Uncharacterized protein n=4 Tax=Diphasiastrum complanatum TaxID=34168 RepID=A0ACC2BVY8_DIPCM|nr:hypothetical protein O6H91_13G071200 [Diphasiastrum complanatum]KAJ7533920.1 hypothetical protein O6H91_13G071200 [Diphasiastrum complanatum]KAJ7533921.1 hypothetical protein O6H91_13G071200 [Diphasiastrum complanatum]KAJ7533922.1 hypothetical protein O6H91_13G071200 [Diphasiastrum complanatum]